MNRMYESAADTAKKIRKALKESFGGVKFSVRSSTYSMGSSVDVHWMDGPMQKDVDEVLNRFKSGSFDGMQDMYESTGYVWEGQIVVGAKYISGSRELSAERQSMIEHRLEEKFAADRRGGFTVRQWEEVERELIAERILSGYARVEASSVNESNGTEESPGPAKRRPENVPAAPKEAIRNKVVLFPSRGGSESASRGVEDLLSKLTPEQRLKLIVLIQLMGPEAREEVLNGVSVDTLFGLTATRMFERG